MSQPTTSPPDNSPQSPHRKVSVVIVSGLSGSGKSTAIRALEDIGYFCIDNLPVSLLPTFLLACDQNDEVTKVALVVDIRAEAFASDLKAVLRSVRDEGHPLALAYLETTPETLIRRFSETRRRHPLSQEGMTISQAISTEQELLAHLREEATLVVDTSDLNVHNLRKRIIEFFGTPEANRMRLVITSFGFKHGLPPEADYVFDVRFLPNPYFVPGLRAQTGLDQAVQQYIAAQSGVSEFFEQIHKLLDFVLPRHDNEGKAMLTVAIGCTGGRHRSVYVAEMLGKHLLESVQTADVIHRDVGKR